MTDIGVEEVRLALTLCGGSDIQLPDLLRAMGIDATEELARKDQPFGLILDPVREVKKALRRLKYIDLGNGHWRIGRLSDPAWRGGL